MQTSNTNTRQYILVQILPTLDRMTDKEAKISSSLSGESVRVIAESVGVTSLPEEAAIHLAEDATYRLKQTLQVTWLL